MMDNSLKTDLTGKNPAHIQAELLRARLLLNTYADLERLYGAEGANEICKEGVTITVPVEIKTPLRPGNIAGIDQDVPDSLYEWWWWFLHHHRFPPPPPSPGMALVGLYG